MTAAPSSPRVRALARLITEVTGPAVCAVVALLAVAFNDRHREGTAVWGGVAAVFVAVIPMAFVVRGVRKGWWSDHHVAARRARTVPLLVALASVAVGVLLLVTFDAPRSLVAVVVAMLFGLAVMLGVTRWWKVSIHCAVAAGLNGVLFVLYGPIALLGLAMLIQVAWSRVVLDAHTWPQVVVGAILGGASALSVFPLLR